MTIKFTEAIEEINDESGENFIAYLKEHAPDLVDVVSDDLDKNLTTGDVHVTAAGGDDPKKKKKKPLKDIEGVSVAYGQNEAKRLLARDGGFDPEVETFDSAGSSNAAFDWWIKQVQQEPDIEKLKLKHKTSLEATAAEFKALTESLKDNPTLRSALQQALTVATVGKDAGMRMLRVVRHGATHLNNNDTSVDRVRGWKNVPLSQEGKEEAAKLADKMAKDPPDHMVCSDLKRAHDTAKLIAAATGTKIDEVSDAFRPWNVGKYAGVTSKEAVPILARYACEEPDTAIPGGESFNSFRSRFFTGLADASEKYPDGVLAVVTHHRGERLLAAWEAAGFASDGTIDGKVFTKKGEGTAGCEDMEIPIAPLRAAADTKVTKVFNVPEDYSKIFDNDDDIPEVGEDWFKQAKLHLPDKNMTLSVLKVDAEQRIFYGWAYVSEENGKIIIDKQDDYIDPEDLLKAAEDFTLQGGKLGDMHDQRNVGRVVASFVTTKQNCDTFGIKCDADRRGWILGFKVDDPAVWAKIKSGTQLELSIGGKGERVPEAVNIQALPSSPTAKAVTPDPQQPITLNINVAAAKRKTIKMHRDEQGNLVADVTEVEE